MRGWLKNVKYLKHSNGSRTICQQGFLGVRQYICARAAQNSDGRLCSVPPGRAQREPPGYAGLTSNMDVMLTLYKSLV